MPETVDQVTEDLAVNEDRRWAVGLTQQQFEKEYLTRNPSSGDVVPDVRKWVYRFEPQYHGIDPFQLDEVMDADITVNEEEQEKIAQTPAKCVCGREYNHPVSKWANLKVHQNNCKQFKELKSLKGG